MTETLPPQTLEEALQALERCGNEKVREMNRRNGAPDNQFGVKMGDIRAIAKGIKSNHSLGLALWASGNADAMLLATLIIKPKQLTVEELERMARDVSYPQLADWFTSYVIKQYPAKESVRERWMASPHPWVARAGWSLTAERIVKNPQGLDLGGLLNRLEREMADAPAPTQWTMNFCLAEIGIHFAEHRERAIAIGEKLGLYRDYPVSKGCTSPYAPIWIETMVARQS
jgi:3-methyladenine DNA glycosylase AlkD